MPFFRQYIAPLIVVLLFGLALVATSARIFLPDEMAAPAPIVENQPARQPDRPIANQPVSLSPETPTIDPG